MIRFSIALAAIVLSGAIALGQRPTAEVEVEPFVGLSVGDPVSIRVSILHESGAQVAMDGSLVDLGEMEPSTPRITVVSDTETLVTFQTRSFTIGSFEVVLPAIPILLADGTREEVILNPVLISVESVLIDDSQPRPNTAPDVLEADRRTFTPWIVAIIGIGLGFVVARFALRRARAPAIAEPSEEQTPVARQRVTFAMDDNLDAAEQCRRLANSVRTRLSNDWSLPASALTASEIGPALAAAGAPGVVVLRVTRLLEACDRVQFGGEQPTSERLHGYLQLAEAIWEDGDST